MNTPLEIFNKYIQNISKGFDYIFYPELANKDKYPIIAKQNNIIFGENNIFLFNLIKLNIDVNDSRLRISFLRELTYIDFKLISKLEINFRKIEQLATQYNLLYSSMSKNYNSVSELTVKSISDSLLDGTGFGNVYVLPVTHVLSKTYGLDINSSFSVKFSEHVEKIYLNFGIYKVTGQKNSENIPFQRFENRELLYEGKFLKTDIEKFVRDLFYYTSFKHEVKDYNKQDKNGKIDGNN